MSVRRAAVVVFIVQAIVWAGSPSPEQIEFFEKRVRPVLAAQCFACHGRASIPPMGGLRLDTREMLLHGGKHGPAILPGDPDNSALLKAVSYREELKMPPAGKLTDEQIADLAAWIKMGAPEPAVLDPAPGDKFWAFQPVRKPAVPAVKHVDWVQSPVDAFVLAKLEAGGLPAPPPVNRRALIRRATFDLTGLPPSPAEVDAFLADNSPGAFRRLVERLLASPSYGERWARHWLDLVRFAETNGHEFDNDKLDPWRYRDYVIRAFNQDLPYDQFAREHIAGDLLPQKRRSLDGSILESPLGTTFFWFGEVLNSATDSAKSRADQVDNQIDVMSKTFQGLTVSCARCHNHKFDPIPSADYYALAGVMHSTDLREAVIDSPERTAKINALRKRIEGLARPQNAPLATVHYRPEDNVFADFAQGTTFNGWTTEGAAFGDRPLGGMASSFAAGSDRFVGTLTSPKFRTTKKLYLHIRVSGSAAPKDLAERGSLRFTSVCDGYKGQHIVPSGSETPEWRTLTLTLERERICYFEIVDRSRDGHIAVDKIVFSDLKTPPPTDPAPAAVIDGSVSVEDIDAEIPQSAFAMVAADYEPHNVRVHIRGNHNTLGEEAPRRYLQAVSGEQQPPILSGSGRLYLADCMTSPTNPLTARVMVNRIWKHHFGEGIVKSVDNFGAMGDRPSNPALLDYLAARFVEEGWSIKAMHRLIVLSSAYQAQSVPPRRLEAEAIRDSILAVAGQLDSTLYGPSVPPYISRYQDGRGKPTTGPLDGKRRRSIYIQARRNFLTPLLLVFDYPLPISTIGARSVSNVPSQALLFMNNEFIANEAAEFAKAALSASVSPRQRIVWMYRNAFARPPEPSEVASIERFVQSRSGSEEQIWAAIAQVLFCTPEFIYVQ
jgi:cytochrome c553